MTEGYFNIAVDAPLNKPLTYKISVADNETLVGSPVLVPLGKRQARGVILEATEKPPSSGFEIKSIHCVHGEWPQIPQKYLEWMRWVSNYYMHPIGQVAQLFFPALEKKEGKSRKTNLIPEIKAKIVSQLTDEQEQITSKILNEPNFKTHLIWGVTGSGKTEVYLKLFEQKLNEGKQGLFLVPEISLTPQLIRRFSEKFGDQVAVIHSQLTQREKTNQWWSIVENKKKILIGARSALFCPFYDLGLIVVDEEHEASFKQDEKLKYHARDSAIVLAQILNIPICLGSATPSLESWNNAKIGRYSLHKLTHRYKKLELPEVNIIDMRASESKNVSLPSWLSLSLFEKTKLQLEQKKQVAFFLNRRGMARSVLCRSCGHIKMCPNCEISLSLHGKSYLVCHYCDFHETLKGLCDHCKQSEYISIGAGTEKIETDLKNLFPKARLLRIDRDEINNRESLTSAIESIEKNEVDILIGTQMIAKGLDFKNLSLVGIVLADIGFSIPDFRTVERSFQLLTQMSGRSGRHQLKGEVIIQTYNPEFPSLGFVKTHNYEAFANFELEQRASLHYPPFGRMACVRIQGINQEKTKNAALRAKKLALTLIKKYPNTFINTHVLGPAPAAIAKLQNKYRFNMILRAQSGAPIKNLCREIVRLQNDLTGIKLTLDIDPIHTL